jgi:D-3-phosphoglycerate dehydrogenase
VSLTVLVTDYAFPDLDVEERVLRAVGARLLVAPPGAEDELAALAPQADAILTNWRPVTARVLDAATRCRTVARYGVGVDNIDVAHATELGIAVTNVPDFCTDEAADHTLLLLLALARRFVPLTGDVRRGGWDNQAGGMPIRLRGRTLGLVGLGAIGSAVAARARALGMDVVAYRRSGQGRDGVRVTTSLPDLLASADVVSLHVPLTGATRGIIGAAELAAMKDTAYLVNTARGGLVDTAALVRALDEGRIAGAALDVTDPEPLPPGHALRDHPAVIVTPHAAFYSDGAVAELAEKAAGNVARILRGEIPATVVNPAVLTAPGLRVARPV